MKTQPIVIFGRCAYVFGLTLRAIWFMIAGAKKETRIVGGNEYLRPDANYFGLRLVIIALILIIVNVIVENVIFPQIHSGMTPLRVENASCYRVKKGGEAVVYTALPLRPSSDSTEVDVKYLSTQDGREHTEAVHSTRVALLQRPTYSNYLLYVRGGKFTDTHLCFGE